MTTSSLYTRTFVVVVAADFCATDGMRTDLPPVSGIEAPLLNMLDPLRTVVLVDFNDNWCLDSWDLLDPLPSVLG